MTGAPPEPPVLVYDGDCGFCSASVRWLHGQGGSVSAVPWQRLGAEGLRAFGLTETDVATAAWYVASDGRRRRGHQAIAAGLRDAGGLRRVLGVTIAVPPGSWLARPVYAVVARWRHRLPPRTGACRVPSG
jgi:predicted DCC family thiol-disulfide oxidoreductase YuxK